MNLAKLLRRAAATFALVGIATLSQANTIVMNVAGDGTVSYYGSEREAWLKSGIGGYAFINGNPKEEDVESLYSGNWFKEGELTAVGTNDLFTVSLTSGSWGNGPLYGTWSIDQSFWLNYGRAAITMHVGNGNGNPDGFIWEVSTNALSGTFYYKDLDSKGGGLSNLFLYGAGEPTQVPDGGVTAILLGAGLLIAGLFRRKAV